MKIGLMILLALVIIFLLGAIMSGFTLKDGKISFEKPEFGFGAVIIISTFVISSNITARRAEVKGFGEGYKEGLTDGGKIVQEKMIKALNDEVDKLKKDSTTSFY